MTSSKTIQCSGPERSGLFISCLSGCLTVFIFKFQLQWAASTSANARLNIWHVTPPAPAPHQKQLTHTAPSGVLSRPWLKPQTGWGQPCRAPSFTNPITLSSRWVHSFLRWLGTLPSLPPSSQGLAHRRCSIVVVVVGASPSIREAECPAHRLYTAHEFIWSGLSRQPQERLEIPYIYTAG